MNEKKFTNPYQTVSDVIRIQPFISRGDNDYIRCIRTDTGTTTTVMTILYSKLIEALKKRGISDLTHRAQFEEFVINCIITEETNGQPTRSGSTARGSGKKANG